MLRTSLSLRTKSVRVGSAFVWKTVINIENVEENVENKLSSQSGSAEAVTMVKTAQGSSCRDFRFYLLTTLHL